MVNPNKDGRYKFQACALFFRLVVVNPNKDGRYKPTRKRHWRTGVVVNPNKDGRYKQTIEEAIAFALWLTPIKMVDTRTQTN